jgi:hypothetical protein
MLKEVYFSDMVNRVLFFTVIVNKVVTFGVLD